MRFAPHTALPRVKGMHQPRDSAVFFSKQTATATAGGSVRGRAVAQAVKGEEGRAAVPTLSPACAPSPSRRTPSRMPQHRSGQDV